MALFVTKQIYKQLWTYYDSQSKNPWNSDLVACNRYCAECGLAAPAIQRNARWLLRPTNY